MRAKIALAVAAVVAALGVAEIAVRVLDLGPYISPIDGYIRLSENPVLKYEFLPGARAGRGRGLLVINSHGMRDLERSRSKAPGTYRIACIGDSICQGFGIPREEAFPARLETHLNGRVRRQGSNVSRFEVLNFGVPGYSIEQIVEHLRVNVARFEPDAVVYGYCLNDPQEQSLELASISRGASGEDPRFWAGLRAWIGPRLSWSRLFLLVDHAVRSHAPSASDDGADTNQEADPQVAAFRRGNLPAYLEWLHSDEGRWQRVEQGLSDLAATARTMRVPVLVAVFPELDVLDEYPIAATHGRLVDAIQAQGVFACDLLRPFQSKRDIREERIDPLHPGPVGHDLAAAMMAERLIAADLWPIVVLEESRDIADDDEVSDSKY